jgi:diguanylate cyclase (GGDEF)-like protein
MMLARWTGFGTLSCIGVALVMNYLMFRDLGAAALQRSVLSAVIIPILLAGPLFFYLTLKLRELAAVNHQLALLATTDGLTACLNRNAFTSGVEAWLRRAAESRPPQGGALLIIDADYFKRINDRYGHHQGDEALKLISQSIRAALRHEDLIGRIGGEEFGVFLPGATVTDTTDVAERIRRSVQEAQFGTPDKNHRLSVSVGCAAFSEPIGFPELFRLADSRLYEAKRGGRNRVILSRVPELAAPAGQASLQMH